MIWVEEADQDLANWYSRYNIALLSTDILINKKFSMADYYLLERQKRNFGAAVDLLRIEILDVYGGWYFDMDVSCIKPVKIENYKKNLYSY